MSTPNPNIGDDRPVIRQLDEAAINRIAAGEVVERPASAVKELIENAIDAGATRVDIAYADGGKSLIRVVDDGCGIAADELTLALSRHATSKIDGSDLLNIRSFGFRGEALPSLGAVGRLTIKSRTADAEGATISVSGGVETPVRPAAVPAGTIVELADLFYATPARLKFLRSDRAEARLQDTQSDSFAIDLKRWRQIMQAYEDGGHAYHATMPTDALRAFRDTMAETQDYGFENLREAQWALGNGVRAMLKDKGIVSVAAEGFGAPGVVVSYTADPEIQNGKKFAALGMQIAAGVPLQCDEPAGFSTFRLGLFGLDKLYDVDGTIARLKRVLDQVL